MFGISFEHILIVGIVLLLFGPRRLPELGQSLGKAMKNFKDAISGVEEAKFKQVNSQTTTQANTATPTSTTNNTSANPTTNPADQSRDPQAHV